MLRFLYDSKLIDLDVNTKEDISIVSLKDADFSGAILVNVYLGEANLHKTNLSHANLSGVSFECTDLTDADLRGADLRGARLFETKMDGAKMDGADLRGVIHTVFTGWPEGVDPEKRGAIFFPE